MNQDEAKRILVKELGWPEWMVELGIRAKFRCEYCNKYMLSDIDTYDGWQKDHIIPGGDEDLSNLAIACKTCNFVKRHSNPQHRSSGDDRESLLAAAREIVNERRRKKEEILEKTRVAAEALIKGQG